MIEQPNADLYRDLLGLPNVGVYLVGVIESSDDAREDRWSYIGNHQMGTLESVAREPGCDRGDVHIVEPDQARQSAR